MPVLSCTPDPTTNSETTNPNFKYLFDQLEQVLQVFSLFGFTNIIGQNICENSGFIVSELVVGCGEPFWTGLNSFFFFLVKKILFITKFCHFGQGIKMLTSLPLKHIGRICGPLGQHPWTSTQCPVYFQNLFVFEIYDSINCLSEI